MALVGWASNYVFNVNDVTFTIIAWRWLEVVRRDCKVPPNASQNGAF